MSDAKTKTEAILDDLSKSAFREGYQAGLLELAKDICWQCEKEQPTFSSKYKMWVHEGRLPRCRAQDVFNR